MKRHVTWMGIAGALALLAAACRDDGVTGLEKAAVHPRGERPAASSIEVIPTSVNIDKGEYYWLRATLRDAEGQPWQGRQPIDWTSSNPDLVEVSSGDSRVIVKAKAAGFATITARYGALSGLARVTVGAAAPEPNEKDEGELGRGESGR